MPPMIMIKKSAKVQRILTINGMRVALEFLPKQKRFGRSLRGMGYGYIQTLKGEDGEPLDCYVSEKQFQNPELKTPMFALKQLTQKGVFDEVKIMIGFQTKIEAERAYNSFMPPKMNGGAKLITGGLIRQKYQ